MKTVVVYASRKGNTRRVAEEIAKHLRTRGSVEMYEVSEAPFRLPEADLYFFGAPTEGHAVMPAMTDYLKRFDDEPLAGKPAAVFDTRIDWPRILSGSAADGIAKRLREARASLVVEPESFIVNKDPELLPGELERVGPWADQVGSIVEPVVPVPV
jgi:flavodoxin